MLTVNDLLSSDNDAQHVFLMHREHHESLLSVALFKKVFCFLLNLSTLRQQRRLYRLETWKSVRSTIIIIIIIIIIFFINKLTNATMHSKIVFRV